MVSSIDNALIEQFSDMVHMEAQQMASKLKPYVQIVPMKGEVFAYDGLGTVEAREVVGRNVPATFDNIEHTRRRLSKKRFVINLPIDSSDIRSTLLSAESKYAQTIAYGALREYDRTIARAALANVWVGREYDTLLTPAQDGVITVDATAGLTYEKLLEIKQNFIDNDVDEMRDRFFLTVTGAENTALLKEEQLTSADFNRDFNVENGRITRALGMDIITFGASVPSPIIPVVNSQRKLIAASSRGICLGISKDISIQISERKDLIETTQVQVIFEIGGVRTEGPLVQDVTVTA